MAEIKLAKLPERSPVKLVLTISPDLMGALTDYAEIYAETYGVTEPLAELVPAMLRSFLDGDRGFARERVLRGRTS